MEKSANFAHMFLYNDLNPELGDSHSQSKKIIIDIDLSISLLTSTMDGLLLSCKTTPRKMSFKVDEPNSPPVCCMSAIKLILHFKVYLDLKILSVL